MAVREHMRTPNSEQEMGTTIRNKKMTKPKSISIGGEDLWRAFSHVFLHLMRAPCGRFLSLFYRWVNECLIKWACLMHNKVVLRERYEDFFIYLLPSQVHTYPCYQHPYWRVYLITTDELRLTHCNYSKSIVYIMVHFWCCIFNGDLVFSELYVLK